MTVILRSLCALSLLVVFASPSSALADAWSSMPELSPKSKHLKIRWVKYNGSTNGAMTVEIENTSAEHVKFEANGLYFVPKGDPEAAPQRLGAAGPFKVHQANNTQGKYMEKTLFGPKQKMTLSMDVFCIDSHRASPNSKTVFAIAKSPLPKSLRRELQESNQKIYSKHKKNYGAAKGEVQSNMWKTRDKKWLKLQGERKQEKSAPKRQRRQRQESNLLLRK